MALNSVVVMGNLTKDPALKNVGERTLASFTLAVSGFGKDAQASFIDCEAWGKTAELIGEYISKGDSLIVQGRLQQDVWEKDGSKHSKIKVVCEQVHFTGRKKKDPNLDEPIDPNTIPF